MPSLVLNVKNLYKKMLNEFLVLANDLNRLIKQDDEVWVKVWELKKRRLELNRLIKAKLDEIIKLPLDNIK